MKVKIKGPFPEGMKINRAGKTFVAEADGDAYFTGKKKECEHLCAAYCYEVEVDEKVETDAVEAGDENPMVGNGSENGTGEADAKPGTDENSDGNESEPVVSEGEADTAPETGAGEAEVNAEGVKAGTDADVAETASKPSEAIVEPAKKPRRRRAAKKAE